LDLPNILPNGKKTVYLVATLLVTIAVLLGLNSWALSIDVNSLPSTLQPYVVTLIAFLSSGTGTLGIGVGRNALGYLLNLVKGTDADYEIKRLYSTWLYYYGFIGTSVAALKYVETLVPTAKKYVDILVVLITAGALVVDFAFSKLVQ